MDDLISSIIFHEGTKQFAYPDSLGYWSIGIGRCIDKRIGVGLTLDEQLYLLNNDIARCRKELLIQPFYKSQDKVRQDVLIELCFNMGLPNLLKFIKMLAAFRNMDYKSASLELKNSLWAKQVQSDRVLDLQYRIEHGSYRD
jgi:lysozyme